MLYPCLTMIFEVESMIKKRGISLFYVFIILLIITGCRQGQITDFRNLDKNQIEHNTGPVQLKVDFNSVLAYTALLDDSYIYLGVDENTTSYFRVYFSGEVVLLGQVENFYLNMKQSVLIDSNLFVFVSEYDNELQRIENNLVCINLSDNTLMEYENYDNSIAGVPTYSFSDNILTLKNIVENTTITTFIEMVDVEKNDWKNVITCTFDKAINRGNAILALCSDDHNLYIFYDECLGEGNNETYLKIYDSGFHEIKSIKISDEIHDYVMTSHISDMQVFGDYIYIYNASNYGFLGQILNDNLIGIMSERNFELSLSQSSESPLFYIRQSDLYYTINESKLTEHKLQIGEDYSIMTMLSTNETVLVVCYADNKTDFAYLVNKENLKNAILPCK